MNELTFNPAVFVGLLTSSFVAIFAPLALFLFLWRKRGVSPKAFGWGALTFVISQFVLRFPWQIPLNAALLPAMERDTRVLVAWLVVSALTAALFEEWGRFAAYRWVWKDRSRDGGLMLGAGQGGLESIVLIGLSLVSSAALYFALSHGVTLGLPAEALPKVITSLVAVTPGLAFMGGVERLGALMLHCALSLVVLEAVRAGKPSMVWRSVAAHTVVNLTVVGLTRWVNLFAAEAVMVVCSAGLLLWMVRRLQSVA